MIHQIHVVKSAIAKLEKGIDEIDKEEGISQENKDWLFYRLAIQLEYDIKKFFDPKAIEVLREHSRRQRFQE